MATFWGSWRSKGNCLFSWFSPGTRRLYNAKVGKPCLNHSNTFVSIASRCHITQKTSPFHLQYGQLSFKLLARNLHKSLHREGKLSNTWIKSARSLFVANGRPFLPGYIWNGMLCRGVTMVSKKGKRKTCKAVAKRFIRTGKGKLKRWRCGKHHNQSKKSSRRKRFLRKPTYVSKTQLKTLNKMLNGW